MTKPKHGGAGRNQGRKPLDDAEPSVVIQARVTPSQQAKWKRLGTGAWLRPLIDKAKEPQ